MRVDESSYCLLCIDLPIQAHIVQVAAVGHIQGISLTQNERTTSISPMFGEATVRKDQPTHSGFHLPS